jgi:hypothetical protein
MDVILFLAAYAVLLVAFLLSFWMNLRLSKEVKRLTFRNRYLEAYKSSVESIERLR